MTSAIYLIRTPLVRENGITYGGPMRVKVGSTLAYAGFASIALAEEACEHWAITRRHHIEPWEIAVTYDAVESRPGHVLLFQDSDDFRRYLVNPEGFVYAEHLVGLHPATLAG